MGRIQRVTVHHMGPPHVEPGTKTESGRVVRSIQRKHMETDHFADIGYHFLIDPAGRIWEGRAISQQGAHAGDDLSNRGNVGICLMGDFRRDQDPTSEQMASLRSLVEYFLDRGGLDPSSLVTHQEIRPAHMGMTECPGSRLQALVERMRADLRPRRTAHRN
jgi:N-acetyl-anhydromuramyl-L-alanine amidase AmpD